MKKWKQKLQRHLLRPFLYLAAVRFLLGLTLVLLSAFLLGRPEVKPYAALLAAAVFALLGWIAWLRLDGVRLPRLMMQRINIRKKPARAYGDMIDYIDEAPAVTFEDLDDEEKDICLLGADFLCCVLFLALSLLL